MTEVAPRGLREEKKRRVRDQIRSSALALFALKGYRDTTMEQIAASAGVAPRTVYRYFPTKDTLVITDDDDPRLLEEFRSELAHHPPIEALRRSLRSVMVGDDSPVERQRQALINTEPELQAALLRMVIGLAGEYARAIVEHTGDESNGDEAVALAAAAAGIALVTFGLGTGVTSGLALAKFDAALEMLGRGFGL